MWFGSESLIKSGLQKIMYGWQSWFNAPDLKSDEGASPPGVRIPASPPVFAKPLRLGRLFVFGERAAINILGAADIKD